MNTGEGSSRDCELCEFFRTAEDPQDTTKNYPCARQHKTGHDFNCPHANVLNQHSRCDNCAHLPDLPTSPSPPYRQAFASSPKRPPPPLRPASSFPTLLQSYLFRNPQGPATRTRRPIPPRRATNTNNDALAPHPYASSNAMVHPSVPNPHNLVLRPRKFPTGPFRKMARPQPSVENPTERTIRGNH